MKTKNNEWMGFAVDIGIHIDKYCVPQYGDYPDKMIEGFTPRDIQAQLERYVKRIGTGARGKEEAVRDCFKIAHYACILHSKIRQ